LGQAARSAVQRVGQGSGDILHRMVNFRVDHILLFRPLRIGGEWAEQKRAYTLCSANRGAFCPHRKVRSAKSHRADRDCWICMGSCDLDERNKNESRSLQKNKDMPFPSVLIFLKELDFANVLNRD